MVLSTTLTAAKKNKKLESDEIERNSNMLLLETLAELFAAHQHKVRPYEFHKEKGIDFTFELESQGETTETDWQPLLAHHFVVPRTSKHRLYRSPT